MDSLSVNQKVIISFVVGIIIGGGAVWLFSLATNDDSNVASVNEVLDKENEMTEEDEEETTGEAEEGGVANGSASSPRPTESVDESMYLLAVSDQASGETVTVDSVSSPGPVWVAVHEDRNGELGNVLGAKWFSGGAQSGAVKLLRTTSPGSLYYVALYGDAGDDRQFALGTDPQITGTGGTALIRVFQTTSN